ncbi:MAG: oligosaccharide flippase family protein [bacterium]|nr:oligosaccharide flippase family protein [bacterium]
MHNLVALFYKQIFQEEMGQRAASFFKNFSLVAAGTGVATILTFTFNIFAGRILGPGEYGEFSLVQSVAMFLCIPMALGLHTTIVKYTSEDENKERQSLIISTGYIFIAFLTIVSIIMYVVFSSYLSNIFSTSKELFFLSLIFAILFTLYTVTTNTLRGLNKMKVYAMFQPVYGLILLTTFFIFVFVNSLSFKSMVISSYLAYGICAAAILIIFLRQYLKFDFLDRSMMKTLIKYSLFATIGGLSFAFYSNVDKILINKYMTVKDVGIYRAYYFASIGVAVILFNMFNTVFFPVASSYKDKKVLFKKINRFIPYLILAGIPFVILCELIIMKFYGHQYPFNLMWMLLLGVASICVCVDGIYGWFFNSIGWQGVKISSFAAIILAIVNIFLNIALIPLMGITGAIVSIIISFSISIIIILGFGRKYLAQ